MTLFFGVSPAVRLPIFSFGNRVPFLLLLVLLQLASLLRALYESGTDNGEGEESAMAEHDTDSTAAVMHERALSLP